MSSEKLKSLLAGIGLAGLVAGVGLAAPGYVHGGSGWGGSAGAGGAEEKAKSGWGGSTGAGGTPKAEKAAQSAPVQKAVSSVKKSTNSKKKKSAPTTAPESK